jgi:hypothetical protein
MQYWRAESEMMQCMVGNGNIHQVRFTIIQSFLNVRVEEAELTTIRYFTFIIGGAGEA